MCVKMADIYYAIANYPGNLLLDHINKINDINSIDTVGDSILMTLCIYEKVDVVRQLLKRPDIDVNYVNPLTRKSAVTVAFCTNSEIFYCLLSHKDTDLTVHKYSPCYRSNLLYVSIAKGDDKLMNTIILSCSNIAILVNQKNEIGEHALNLVCQMGNIALVKRLLEIPGVNNDCLEYLLYDYEAIETLYDNDDYFTDDEKIIKKNTYIKIIQLLVDKGFNLYENQENLFQSVRCCNSQDISAIIKNRITNDLHFLQKELSNDIVRHTIDNFIF